MKKRFYYSDPLAAAWMAKHFGMLFTIDGRDFIFNDWQDILELHVDDCYRDNYYIHSDSVPILEPQMGDLVDTKRIISPFYVVKTDSISVFSVKGSWVRIKDCSIIQRKGILFHWPESKEISDDLIYSSAINVACSDADYGSFN